MYIDPRVAHGRAAFDLDRNPKLHPSSLIYEVESLIVNETRRIQKRAANRRAAIRTVERDLLPRLQAFGASQMVRSDTGQAWLMVLFLARDAQEGIVSYSLRYRLDTRLFDRQVIARMEHHAVARCLQRLGKERVDQIEDEIRCAFAAAIPLTLSANQQKWAQIGIPTPRGLFVGERDRVGSAVLNTFIRPGANDRASRWDAYRALFEGIPPWDSNAPRPRSTIVSWCTDALEEAEQAHRMPERFPFLLDAYERREDPTDQVWKAARTCAAAQ